MELIAARSKGGNNVLGGRLEKSHNVGDKFVLALDCSKGVELVGAEIDGFFNVSCLESGECIVFLYKVLGQRCPGALATLVNIIEVGPASAGYSSA